MPDFPSIPEPRQDLGAVFRTLRALKETVELLTGSRGAARALLAKEVGVKSRAEQLPTAITIPRKAVAVVGDGVNRVFDFRHGLGTVKVVIQVRGSSDPFADIACKTELTSADTARVTFPDAAEPPGYAGAQVVIIG